MYWSVVYVKVGECSVGSVGEVRGGPGIRRVGILEHTALHSTAWHFSTLYCTALHCTALHGVQ